jgi:hypothetical protein
MPPKALTDRQINRLINLFMTGTFEAFEAFCTHCVKITGGDDESGDTSAISLRLWPGQRSMAQALCDPDVNEIIVLKSRQIGVTWVVLAWKLYRCLFWNGIEERITSVGQDEANKALRRIKFMIDHLPEWLGPELEVSNTSTIKFLQTQSWITALPATINAGRGDTLNDILSDEAAFQVYAKQIVTSARPALEKRHGKLIVVSTANGVGNYFQEQYVRSEKGENGFKHFFFGWKADPTRSAAWYERMYKQHGPEYMHENYPETSAQAFLASGRPYFSQDRLSTDLVAPPAEFHDGFLSGKEFLPSATGCIRVWKKPPGRPCVVFSDVAEGLEHGDYSNAYVLDATDRSLLCRVRGKMDVGELADVLYQVSHWYCVGSGSEMTPALTAVESNNHGIAVTKQLLEMGHRNLYYEHDLRTGEVRERVGWVTNEATRRIMLGKFQTDYRMGRCKIPDADLLDEMSLFAHRGTRGKPQAPPGKHDDCVMSYGGAYFLCTYEAPGIQEAREADEESSDIRFWALKDQKRALEVGPTLNHGLVEMGG